MKQRDIALYFVAGLVGVAAYRTYKGTGKNTGFLDALDVLANLIGAMIMQHPAEKMQLSAAGLQRIAEREGFSATRYKDAGGESIGFGHFILPTDSIGQTITRAEALVMLNNDAGNAADAVRAYVTVPITQNMFDALTSFVYNVGAGAFKGSTLLRLLNAGDHKGAAAQFARWNRSQGVHLAVLDTRRAGESAQFLA